MSQATQIQALTEQVQALAEALAAVMPHVLANNSPEPANKPAPAKPVTAKAKAAKKARQARKDANLAAGRMATARYGCATSGCKFGSYNAEPARAHTLKDGHKAVELS
jgi:hypothetical protein